jgi:hypothetical protein
MVEVPVKNPAALPISLPSCQSGPVWSMKFLSCAVMLP